MKTKFKEFIKKIKNWLSSLSKWAQKNKLKVFACVFSIFLLICAMGTCSTNKKTASAAKQEIYGTNLIMLRNQEIYGDLHNWGTNRVYMIPNMVFALNSSTNATLYYLYADSSSSRMTYASKSFIYNNEDNVLYIDNFNPMLFDVTSNTMNDISFSINPLFYKVGLSIYQGDLLTDISYIYYSTFNNSTQFIFTYQFLNSSDILVAEMKFRVLLSDCPIGQTQITSGVVDACYYLASMDTADIYNIAFNQGYTTGYNNGYDYALNDLDLNPLSIVASGVDSFLSTDLFGNFSLGDVFAIAGGIMLFMFCIKMFLGG